MRGPTMSSRFDVCEALNLIAHDWGLYDLKARLDAIPFRCAPSAEFYEGLTEEGRALYDYHDDEIRAGTSRLRSRFLPRGRRWGLDKREP